MLWPEQVDQLNRTLSKYLSPCNSIREDISLGEVEVRGPPLDTNMSWRDVEDRVKKECFLPKVSVYLRLPVCLSPLYISFGVEGTLF